VRGMLKHGHGPGNEDRVSAVGVLKGGAEDVVGGGAGDELSATVLPALPRLRARLSPPSALNP
jgi:hypothetical protein